MRYFQTLPTDNIFFQTYAKFAKGIQSSTYAAQAVSAITESVILYSFFYASLITFSSPLLAFLLALVGAIIGTFLIEIGLRYFVPNAVDAVLYRRFKGLYLAMSIFIICMAVLLIGASAYLSFKGSSKIIKHFTPPPEQATTTKADSLYLISKKETLSEYQTDSTTISQQYEKLITVSEKAFNSRISELQTIANTLPKKSNESWGTWTSRKNKIKIEIKDLEAQRDNKTSALTIEATTVLKSLRAQKKGAIDSLNNILLVATKEIKSNNQKASDKVKNTIKSQSIGIGWFTIICLFYLIVCISIEQILKKGSGITEMIVPTDYYFRQSIFSETLTVLSERFNQVTRQKIANFQAATEPPPQPIEPHHLLNIANFQQAQYTLNFSTNPPSTRITDKIEDATILEEQITSYVEASVTLEEKNLHEQANEMRLKANEVIRTYLQRNGDEPTTSEIEALETKVFEFVNNVTTVNPFATRTIIQGFKMNDKKDLNSIPNGERITVNVGDLKKRNCIYCQELFSYKHWNKKYCSDDCRIKAWEQRTGKKFGKKKR